MLEYSTSQSPLRWNLTKERFEIAPDGTVAVPETPGLGVTLDAETVARFRSVTR
jgi:L-alanine-DL-glutamate epimerase-like enolase superfamily enzyme